MPDLGMTGKAWVQKIKKVRFVFSAFFFILRDEPFPPVSSPYPLPALPFLTFMVNVAINFISVTIVPFIVMKLLV